MTARLRVMVVDDDAFTRLGLTNTLRSLGVDVVADADRASAAMRAARQVTPDAALIDLDLGEGPTGIDLALALRRELPTLGIIVVSSYSQPRLMGIDLPDLPAGAVYLVKQSITNPDVLGKALRQVIHPGTQTAATEWVQWNSADPVLGTLTDEQVEVWRLVAMGCANAEISRRRHINEASVEKAITRLIRSLGIQADKHQNQRVLLAQAYNERIGSAQVRAH